MALAGDERRLAAEGKGCLGKARPDEPVFVLRGQDILAADLVAEWARQAEAHSGPTDKTREALRLSRQMRAWPNRKMPD